jgi:Amt family ammonium transporter
MQIPSLDVAWVLVSASMVFLMQGGFLAVEAGLTRTKNAINVAIKNVTDFGVSLLLFWAVGFGLIFTSSQGGLMGTGLWAPSFDALGTNGTAFLLFQGMFCGTAVTIVAGGVAERMRFAAYLMLAVLVSAAIYPITAHWAWGGTVEGGLGWLRELGFVDFAGSTVVHGVGGAVALAAVLVLGPRRGRFTEEGAKRIPPSNLPMAMLGVLILWFGWIGFNGGSHLLMDGNVLRIVFNTMLSGSAGLVVALLIGWKVQGYADPGAIICGSLGGLVSVTASCHVVDFEAAVQIGAIGGALVLGARQLMERLCIDDAVDAVPVHLACGFWGTMAFALFAPADALVVPGDRWLQLGIQAGGAGVIALTSFAVAYGFLRLLQVRVPLRVSAEEEAQGLNVAEHRAPNDMQDLLTAIDRQAEAKDLSLRAPVEPFTEVGRVADRYNSLIANLQGSLTSVTHLEEVREDLEQALEARKMFLANMSHELRTPLNAILGFADLLLSEDFEKEEVAEFLGHISSSGDHLLEMINDILDLSKMDAGKIQLERIDMDVRVLLEQCAAQLRNKAMENGNSLELSVGDSVPAYIRSDPVRVRQVILNLVSNAVKFTKDGSVRVEMSLAAGSVPELEVAVIDTGMGIEALHLDKIFEEFVQADNSITRHFGGTGLGLPLSRGIARLLGGDLTVESELGQGSTFRFRFPMEAAAKLDYA